MILPHEKPILLIGGLAMKADEHSELARLLSSKTGRRILYFDNINVGDGPRLEGANQLAILDQAHHQWKKVNETVGSETSISIYGISMGGMIASTMATLFPDRVSKLVLAATSANLTDNPSVPDDLFYKWTKAKHEDDIRASTRIAFGATTLESNYQTYEDYFQYRIQGKNKQKAKEFVQQLISIRSFEGSSVYSRLSELSVHTTVLNGAEDTLFDVTHKQDLQFLLPNAAFVELDYTGHMLHLENLPQLASILTKDGVL